MDGVEGWLHHFGESTEIFLQDFGTFSRGESRGQLCNLRRLLEGTVLLFLGLTRESFRQAVAERSAELRLALGIAKERIVEGFAVVQNQFVLPALVLQQ
jgi:hypothetical protein